MSHPLTEGAKRMQHRFQAQAWTALFVFLIAGVPLCAQEEPLGTPEGEIIQGPPNLEGPLPRSAPEMAGDGELMIVDWPMVLDLARASSVEIQIAGERLSEANIQVQLAKLSWIPSLKVGTTWYNSSGRRQEIPGDVIEASKSSLYSGALASASLDAKKVCLEILRAKQQVYSKSGELDRVTRAEIQKVSNAYIDLVAAQAGASISAEITQLIGDLVERSRLLQEQGLLTEVNVLRKQQSLQSQLQQASKARSGQQAASAQLVMLLNLLPGTRLAASWDHLAPVTLVDEQLPEEMLVQQALSQGPGMAEIAAVLQAIEEQQQKIRRIALIPTFVAQSGYGAFGGGQGSNLINFGDRFDSSVGAYWDVLDIVGTKPTRQLFNSKRRQALLEHEKLEAKLAAGVIIARHRSIEARKRIADAEKEVDLAIRAYSQSKKRMDADVAPNREIDLGLVEVLPAIGGLATARVNYLDSVIEYNRAQIELMYLLGANMANNTYQLPNCPPRRYVNGREVQQPPVVNELHAENMPADEEPVSVLPAEAAPTSVLPAEAAPAERLTSPTAPSPPPSIEEDESMPLVPAGDFEYEPVETVDE